MLDKPVTPDAAKDDDSPPPAGHNNPPAYDLAAHAEFAAKVDEFLEATRLWLNLDEIKTEQEAQTVTDQIAGLRALFKKVDDQRKAEKKPHDDAGKAVQKAFTPLTDKLQRAADKLKAKLGVYVTKKAEAEAKAKAEAEAEARRKAEEAAEQARLAAMDNDIGAAHDAEEALKAAEKELKQASKPARTQVKSATGAGRTLSQRTVKDVQIDNINTLFLHFREHEDVQAVLTNLALRTVRAADYDPDKPLPGVTVIERKVIA